MNYNKKNTFLNPVFQNYAHISSLKEVLADQYNGPYFSVIAFSTKATLKEIELKSDYVEVVYMPQLVKTILANKSAVISTGLAKRLAKKIEGSNIVGKEHRKTHVQAIRNKSQKSQTSINNKICPRCNGQLVTRNGKYGKFQGCSNFPKCRYVVNR